MERRFDSILAELRRRVALQPSAVTSSEEGDALTRALHELDVYHAELVIQNQDLVDTQRELTSTRERYRELFEEAPSPVVLFSSQGTAISANRAAEILLTRKGAGLVGKPFVVRLAEGESDKFFRHLSAVKEATAPQTIELNIKGDAGEVRRWHLRTALLTRENPATLLCHFNDVTEERAATEAKIELERRLAELGKLEAVGRVAANIAHEVNNLLVSVISLGEHARAAVSDSTRLAADLDELIDGAWRGARLMRGLLGLSRGAAAEPRSFDVCRTLASVAAMLRYKKPGVGVLLDSRVPSAFVLGHEDEMLQALLNVGKNAVESMTIGAVQLSASIEPSPGGGAPTLCIRCSDQGSGMSVSQRARAFEPLFTTKSASGGSGLGLTLVQKTVTSHGGTIDIESQLGVGTLVSIRLPLEGERARSSLPARSAVALLDGLNVLLVDDDDRVRRATIRQLKAMGAARVDDFPDAHSALEAACSGLRFDVAVVDVNMPGWSGPELVRRMVERMHRAVPVVLVTGAAGDLVPDALLAEGSVILVRKPWTREELAQNVHKVIAAVRQADAGRP